MVLEKKAPIVKKTTPEVLKSPRPYSEKIKKEKGRREGQENQVAVSALHSAKKGLNGSSSHIGPLTIEQVHSVSNIQDVNPPRSETTVTSRFLDNISRPQRRLLAHTYSSKQKTLPRIPIQKPKLAISGSTLRFKCGTSHIYQGNGTCGKCPISGRNLVPDIPGRPPDHFTNQGHVSSSYGKSTSNNKELWPYHQRKEITYNPFTRF